MKLYHGTTKEAWERIKQEGLLPRKHHGNSNWKETVESAHDAVYLTDAYGLYFAFAVAHSGDDYVVIEIDTDLIDCHKMVADEDVLEQIGRKNDDGLPPEWGMKKRTQHYRRTALMCAQQGLDYEWSLHMMGTCAYKGSIPVSAITRVAIVNGKKDGELVVKACDPTITVMNYKVLGDYYRGLTKMVFGMSAEQVMVEEGNLLGMAYPTINAVKVVEAPNF